MSMAENYEKNVIDEFYEEAPSNEFSKHNLHTSKNEFMVKLRTSLNKMDIIEKLDYDLSVNILDIINHAEEIKNKKKARSEFIYFLLVSLVILSAALFLVFNLGGKFILYSQLFISTVMPLLLVPYTLAYRAKEGK